MNKMQIMLLEMLKWFHGFCQENGIVYYVIGGTMLGTIRHKGFIPWDDDIDVGIPRADYEKLLANKDYLFKNENRYCLESFRDGKTDFEYPYAKIYDTQTTLIENCRTKTKRGIYIDVFPLDGIGDNKEEAYRNYSHILKKINFLMTRVCTLRKGRAWMKNMAIIISQLIPQFILKNHGLIERIDNICKSRNFETSEYVGCLVGNWGMKEIIPKQYLGTPMLYKFEDTEVYGPEKFDEYLTCLYGNWRKMPPIEKQKSHHNYLFLDLNKSYLDKKNGRTGTVPVVPCA